MSIMEEHAYCEPTNPFIRIANSDGGTHSILVRDMIICWGGMSDMRLCVLRVYRAGD